MLDGFHIISLTHRHAPIGEIENVIVRGENDFLVQEKLQALKAEFGWQEVFYLATCNRVFYFFYAPTTPEKEFRQAFLTVLRPDLSAAKIASLAARMLLLNGTDAVRHLFEVASSMDSLVVGEREILRQLREAYARCQNWGLTGDHIRLAMRHCVEIAKEVYTATGIGQKQVSVVSLAFGEMMKNHLPTEARIVMIGAGQTNELFAKFLVKQGFRRVTIFNRTLEKAEKIARNFAEGLALPLSEIEFFAEGFDALVVCTASQTPVVTSDLYQKLLAGETSRKVAVDLSVPHNIDRQVVASNPVRYVEIEGLRDIARENLQHRENERIKADGIVARRVLAFRGAWHERQVERSLANIPGEVLAVKEKAIKDVFRKEFESLDAAAQATVLKMLDYMEKKCVAIPMKAAKAIAIGHANASKNSLKIMAVAPQTMRPSTSK